MAKAKLMTPGELRSAKAVLKQELSTHTATIKAADKAVKDADKAHIANVKSADRALAEAIKAHAAAVKASLKAFEAVRKEQSKANGQATTASAKLTAKLQVLDTVEPVAATKAKDAVAA